MFKAPSDPPSSRSADLPAAIEFPPGMLGATRVPAFLLRRGLPMGPLALLVTTGRRTGADHTVPVVVLRTPDATWLVSPFGDTAWVRNVRRDARARLRRGRVSRTVTLHELPVGERAEILRRYRRRFGAIPFVRAAFEASGSDAVAAFAAEADRHPVFRIEAEAPRRGRKTETASTDA